MAYTLSISECQRRILMRALTHLGTDEKEIQELKNEPGDVEHGGYDRADEEYIALVQMFGTLPDDEKNNPGVIHGFCL